MIRLLSAVLITCCCATALDAAELRPLRVIVFSGGQSWPVYVAQDRRFFEKHGLATEITETPGSKFQITGLYEGRFDIAMTPFDNVVAYQEGQGEAVLADTPDLFTFMGGLSTALHLIADPKVPTLADLKGRTLGIDSATSGYALLMYELLDRSGVPFGSYELKAVGGTTFRVQALEEGKIAATMVSSPQEIGPEEKGFRQLGDVRTTIGAYQSVSGAARRSWAAQHSDLVQEFIAAYREADAWLRDPANHDAALDIYLHHARDATRATADKALKVMLSPNEGFQPDAAFDPDGAATVMAVRSKFGTPRKTLTGWQTYYDSKYFDAVVNGSR